MTEFTVDQALQQGIEAHKTGKVQEADRLYTAILKAQPRHPDANHNMGVLAVGVGKVEQALPFFKTALEANPTKAQYWLSYIDTLIKLDKLTEAKAVLDQAKSKGAQGDGFDKLEQRLHETAQEPLEASKIAIEAQPPKPFILDSLKLDQAIKLAKKKAKEGSPEEAKRIYQEILTKFPKNKRARDGLKGLVVSVADKASKVQDVPRGELQSLINLYNKGQLALVVEHAQGLTKRYPEAFAVWNLLGVAAAQIGQLDQTIFAYNKALAIKPDYAEAYNNLGNALKEQGKLAEAIEAYNKALAIKPDYAEPYNNLGVTLKGQGKLEEAIEAYNKALAIKPDHAEAHYNMGNAFKSEGKLEEAIEAYDRALAIKPDYAHAKHILLETLKIYSPKNKYRNALVHIDNKIKLVHNKYVLPKIDHELAAHTSSLLNELQNADTNLSTRSLQIYKRNNVDLNCKRHVEIFNKKEIIPKFCFGCYKVQVDVLTVLDLIRLAALFYKIEFESDLTRKCLVEVRPNIPGSYKGLIYCRGIDQAHSVKKQLNIHLRDLNKNLVAKIKKGCSEFPLAFPKYGEVAAREEEMMQYPQEWQALENEFDAKTLMSPDIYVNSSLKEFCLSDYLIIHKWIDYAKGIGDPTSKLFCSVPIKYGNIWEIAKARSQ